MVKITPAAIEEPEFTWEKTDKVDELKAAAGL
jgi:S-adenosylmethionine synthetase